MSSPEAASPGQATPASLEAQEPAEDEAACAPARKLRRPVWEPSAGRGLGGEADLSVSEFGAAEGAAETGLDESGLDESGLDEGGLDESLLDDFFVFERATVARGRVVFTD